LNPVIIKGWKLTDDVNYHLCGGKQNKVDNFDCSVCGETIPDYVISTGIKLFKKETPTMAKKTTTKKGILPKAALTQPEDTKEEDKPVAEGTIADNLRKARKECPPVTEDTVVANLKALLQNPKFVNDPKVQAVLKSVAPKQTKRTKKDNSDDSIPLEFDVKPSSQNREGFIELYFNRKPGEDVRTEMKNSGFRWGRFHSCWYGRADLIVNSEYFGSKVKEFLDQK
jgi:hypothetical protein